MIKLMRYFVIVSVVVTLSACSLQPLKKRGSSDAEQTADDAMKQQAPNVTEAIDEGSLNKFVVGDALDVSSLSDPDSPLSQRIIYFELDSSEVQENDRNILAVHAELLATNPDITVVLEGHADERGSREYNIALGEKRANAVMQLLTLQGVAPNQVQVISFGEERPAAIGHDAAAWNLNRRVEILYTGY